LTSCVCVWQYIVVGIMLNRIWTFLKLWFVGFSMRNVAVYVSNWPTCTGVMSSIFVSLIRIEVVGDLEVHPALSDNRKTMSRIRCTGFIEPVRIMLLVFPL
jgi:hypothetical protein